MPLDLGEAAVLTGPVSVEEAEPLAAWLREHPGGEVDLTACTHLHTAALQALLSARPPITGEPSDEFLSRWVLPLLRYEDDD